MKFASALRCSFFFSSSLFSLLNTRRSCASFFWEGFKLKKKRALGFTAVEGGDEKRGVRWGSVSSHYLPVPLTKVGISSYPYLHTRPPNPCPRFPFLFLFLSPSHLNFTPKPNIATALLFPFPKLRYSHPPGLCFFGPEAPPPKRPMTYA